MKALSYEVLVSRYHYNYDYRYLRERPNERERFVVAYLPKKATPAAYRILQQLLIGFLSWRTAYECDDATAYNAIHDAYQYKVREVGYNFDEINAFKGPPVEEVDKQWDLLLNGVHTVRLSKTELERMNMSSIQLADGSEDYIAVPIVYHMLHCLYNIYRYAHPDFFGEDPNGPEWIVTHTDHCIDNLRQFVQCHGGNGFETYRWLDNRKLPWPVVSTDEVCIDWPHFDGWVRDHGVSSHDMHEQQLLVHPKFGPIYDADLSVHSHET
ncbi:hypothetical protein V495_01465 [Pseudogymnoascus sp. VKM F-4514 (FW-929)]|nr:hypothetical protein V495_01465 [Pseudogymnoascus sp. VKM F-4514 (FW-929)]KFY55763.1 hypothetical protein V497_06734 [Pseudogymnoascus sp. VKM F-4516 (FW-969)]